MSHDYIHIVIARRFWFWFRNYRNHSRILLFTLAMIQGLCDCADPQDIVTHVVPILTRLANDPDVFVQTSTVICFAVMLQRASGMKIQT